MDWRAEMDGVDPGSEAEDEQDATKTGKTRKPSMQLELFPEAVRGLAFACGGELLITGDASGQVRVWSAKNGILYYTQQKHDGAITSIVTDCGADERDLAASCGADSRCHVWEVRTNLSLFVLSAHTATVWKCVFSPRGGVYLATCSADHTARVWDTRTGRTVTHLRGHEGGVVGVAWSPDIGHSVATCSWDRTARLWNGLSGRCLHVFDGHHDWVTALAFSVDGTSLATCSNDCTVRVWNPMTGKKVGVYQEHKADVNCLAFSGSLLASSSQDRSVRIVDVNAHAVMHCLSGHRDNVPFVGYIGGHHDQAYALGDPSATAVLISCCDDQIIRLWDIHTGDLLESLLGHKAGILAWDATEDAELLATADKSGAVFIWKLNDKKSRRRDSCAIL